MFTSSARSAVVVTAALAAFTVSCGAEPATPRGGPAAAAPSATASAAPAAPGSAAASAPGDLPAEKVRDAFAGLQATLNDACTPGNCAYFLGRVHDELHRLDRAMKADPKGAGHFPEPIALIAKLDGELGGDRSFENLTKHQKSLIGTRDEINAWMQGHPDDYR
ncbi:hypothetical protein ACFCZ1_00575 [Streptomyces sp. NPDC056224]|uniref:hypothetical protein n=1 Tax=Streptomyces sp. NPDC056224 TaxID=3345750 RepID=UPI0035DA5CF9